MPWPMLPSPTTDQLAEPGGPVHNAGQKHSLRSVTDFRLEIEVLWAVTPADAVTQMTVKLMHRLSVNGRHSSLCIIETDSGCGISIDAVARSA